MSIFLEYPNKIFTDISKIETILITADTNTIWVNNITVCNKTAQTIRFNLKLKKQENSTAEAAFLINELSIEPFKSLDVLTFLGLNVYLEYNQNPSISDSLICYSNGSTQKFDCIVNYTKLNELPLT